MYKPNKTIEHINLFPITAVENQRMCRIWKQRHLFHYQLLYVCGVHVQSRIGCSP